MVGATPVLHSSSSSSIYGPVPIPPLFESNKARNYMKADRLFS
jgi:hypothetical protein